MLRALRCCARPGSLRLRLGVTCGGGEMESVGVLMRENMALGCSLCGRRTNLGAGEGRGQCATATEPVHDGGAVGDCR